MFQMELMRRNAAGRLSEIAGPATLPIDKLMRTLGLRQSAMQDYETLPDRTQAHAAGLCQRRERLDRRARPLRRAGVPGAGRAAEMAAGGQPAVGQDHGAVAVDELAAGAVAPGAGRQGAADADRPALAAGGRAAIRKPRAPCRSSSPMPRLGWMRCCRASPRPSPCRTTRPTNGRWTAGTASPARRCWPATRICSSASPASGTWRGSTRRTRPLVGATAPGVPGVVMGRNRDIAWTFTTTGADVQDIFIEQPAGPGEYHDPRRPAPVHDPRGDDQGARPAGRGAEGALHPARPGDQRPAARTSTRCWRWTMANLAPDDTAAEGLFALDRPKTVAQAGKAAALITSPVQNLLVADRQHIGLFVTGRVPIRRAGDGIGAGHRRRLARLDRLGVRQSVAALCRSAERQAGERERADRAAGLPGVPRPRLVRRLAGEAHPADAGRRPTSTPRPGSPACRRMCAPPSRSRCCRRCWR